MNEPQPETEEISISVLRSVLKQIDRIVKEKNLTREKVINDVLENHFSGDDDWYEDIIK